LVIHAVRYSKMAIRLKTKLPKLIDNFKVIITDKIIGFVLIVEIMLFLSNSMVVAGVTITTTVSVEDM